VTRTQQRNQAEAADGATGGFAKAAGYLLRGRSWPPFRGSRRSGGWLGGLGLNLVLSLLYLLVAPLTEVPHGDWAILVGSYFAGFILADSCTTNALGADAGRVTRQLCGGTSLGRILIAKNLTLVLVAGLPILSATAVITLQSEPGYRLALTIPAVLGLILTWLGLGNLISVLLPVSAVPLRQRWLQRSDLVSTGRWLLVVALPYALCFAMDPLTNIGTSVFHTLSAAPAASPAGLAAVVLASGLTSYGCLTMAALSVTRRRGLRFHDLVAPANAGSAPITAMVLAA
jgi:hypothetical protein